MSKRPIEPWPLWLPRWLSEAVEAAARERAMNLPTLARELLEQFVMQVEAEADYAAEREQTCSK